MHSTLEPFPGRGVAASTSQTPSSFNQRVDSGCIVFCLVPSDFVLLQGLSESLYP